MPLTDIETRICQIVVRRFLDRHEATSRDDLLSEFKTNLYTPLQNLTNRFVIYSPVYIAGSETFLPKAIAFHYSQDADALSRARRSAEVVLMAIRDLFDQQLGTRSKELLTPKDVLAEVQKTDPSVRPDTIWLGLYFAREFSVFAMSQPEADQIGIVAFRPHEYIYDVVKTEDFWDQRIQEGIKSVEHNWTAPSLEGTQSISEIPGLEAAGIESHEPARQRKTVFVIHGRDERLRNAVFAFLRALHLEPLEWIEAIQLTRKASPYIGEILKAAFKKAQAVVVLLSPDDETKLCERLLRPDDSPSERELAGQARPNVLFEAGMAFGSHDDRTVLVQFGEVRPFSDVAGRHIVKMDDSTEKRQELAAKLKAAGCSVDTDGADWLSTGDLTPPTSKPKTSSAVDLPQQLSNIVYLKSLPQPRYVRQDGEGMWGEVGRGGDGLLAATAIFRNDPITGVLLNYIRKLTAQITFFAPIGGEVQRVNRGVWLNDYDEGYTQTSLAVGDTRELLVAVKQPHSSSVFSVEGATRMEIPLALPRYDVKVKLIGTVLNPGDINDEFRFKLDLRGEAPILTFGWF